MLPLQRLVAVIPKLALAGLILVCLYVAAHHWSAEPYRSIATEMGEFERKTEVVARFGKPVFTFRAGDEDYYIDGYSYEKRAINNEVLVFFPAPQGASLDDIILYVYIDSEGNVEHFFVGGS